jgi:prepilin-type processing-associated H-X9-DG protein
MKKKLRLSLWFILCLGSWVCAADQAVMQCIDDLAFGVIRLDVKALDFVKSMDTLMALAEKTMPGQNLAHLKKDIEQSRRIIQADLDAFEKAGGREVFVIFSMRDIPACFLVCPVDSGVDRAVLKARIEGIHKASFNIPGLTVRPRGQLILVGKAQTLDAVKGLSSMTKPLWASLLDTSPRRSLHMAIAPNAIQLRVLKEMWPKTSSVPGMDQLGTLVQNCKWVTVSAQVVPDIVFSVTLEMQSEALAGEVVAFWKVAVPMMIKPLGQDSTFIGQVPIRKNGSQVILAVDNDVAEQLLSQFILSPAHKARVSAERITCIQQLRQIAVSVRIYANDHQDQCPPNLDILINSTELTSRELICPGTREKDSYVYCGAGVNTGFPGTAILVYDKKDNHSQPGRNVAFLDGHAEWVEESRFLKLMATYNTKRKEKGLAEHMIE